MREYNIFKIAGAFCILGISIFMIFALLRFSDSIYSHDKQNNTISFADMAGFYSTLSKNFNQAICDQAVHGLIYLNVSHEKYHMPILSCSP